MQDRESAGGAGRLEVWRSMKPLRRAGGDVRGALKAMISANEFLESEICALMQAVSHAYARGNTG
jgi:hypothetical protein